MSRREVLDIGQHRAELLPILHEIADAPMLPRRKLNQLLKEHPKAGKSLFSVDELVAAYRALAGSAGLAPFDPAVIDRLRLKPVRSRAGITPLTVFTKPFPCPGTCIFCPNDVRMPKSYLSNEPGAQRADQHAFDPYLQTYARLRAFRNIGHPLDKIELIVLGGTWSFYPEAYQRWFIQRVFEALNDFGAGIDRTAEIKRAIDPVHALLIPLTDIPVTRYNQSVQSLYRVTLAESATVETTTWDVLATVQVHNEEAICRCVGLSIETRPDYITPAEVIRLRRLGCTKVQLGIQSVTDSILAANQRGHTADASRRAIALCRQAGFKIHAHWMPNLYQATPESDLAEFRELFSDPGFRPDELKIYPCMLIDGTDLMTEYHAGRWHPYTDEELVALLADCLAETPEYCRLTRVIRDIPAPDIMAGSTTSNLRQVAEKRLQAQGRVPHDIRAREVGRMIFDPAELHLEIQSYSVIGGLELFLQFITPDRRLAGFLRLWLPDTPSFIPELGRAAIIREIHVYGQALPIGSADVEGSQHSAQHKGLGSQLISQASELARARNYQQLAVISAVGTRDYYRARGFQDGDLYQALPLDAGLPSIQSKIT